jgi:hypothetical protein
MSKSPFVRAGGIGKVISAPKFIETGIIGTRKIPRMIKFIKTTIFYSAGSVNSIIIPERVTPKHTPRIVHKYLCVF